VRATQYQRVGALGRGEDVVQITLGGAFGNVAVCPAFFGEGDE
jgi:hypothetical protein